MKGIKNFDEIKTTVTEVVNADHINDQLENLKAQISSVKKKVEDFVSKDQAMLMCICCFLAGLVLGMIFSPKGNTTIGSNNQVNNNDDKEDECCADGEECCGDGKCCEE